MQLPKTFPLATDVPECHSLEILVTLRCNFIFNGSVPSNDGWYHLQRTYTLSATSPPAYHQCDCFRCFCNSFLKIVISHDWIFLWIPYFKCWSYRKSVQLKSDKEKCPIFLVNILFVKFNIDSKILRPVFSAGPQTVLIYLLFFRAEVLPKFKFPHLFWGKTFD